MTQQPRRANPHLHEIRTALDRVQELVREQLADGFFPEQAYRPTQWGYWLYRYDRKPWAKWHLCYMIQLVNIESVQRERWQMLLAGDDVVSPDPKANWAAEIAPLGSDPGEPAIAQGIDEWRKPVVRLHAEELDEEFVRRFADKLRSFIEKATRAVDEAGEVAK